MQNESNEHTQHSMELKFVRLVERLENLTKNCDRIGDKVNKELVSKDSVKTIDVEIRVLRKDLDAIANSMTWLVRILFGSMLTSAAGLIVFLIQKG